MSNNLGPKEAKVPPGAFDWMTDAVIHFSSVTTDPVVCLNPAARSMLSLEKVDLTAKNWQLLTADAKPISLDDWARSTEGNRTDETASLAKIGDNELTGTSITHLSALSNRMHASVFVLRAKKMQSVTDEELRYLKMCRVALQAGTFGVWEWQIEEDNLIWDDSMYTLYGVNKHDFSGAYDAWANSLHPEDSKASRESVNKALKGEGDFSAEFRIITNRGEVRHIKAAGQVIFDSDGTPKQMVGINHDITREKQLLNRLAANQQKLNDFFEMAPLGITVNDLDGNFLASNREFKRFTGYTEAELSRLSSHALTPSDYAEDDKKQRKTLRQEGKFGPYEKEYIHKNGQRIPVISYGLKVESHEAEELSIWSIVQDISSIKESQKELLLFRKFFAMTEDLMAICTPDGKLTKVNPKFCKALEYQPDQLLGRNFMDLVHPQDLSSPRQLFPARDNKEKSVLFQCRLNTFSGNDKWFVGSGVKDGDKIYVAVSDVSNLIQSKEKLTRSNEELNSFAYIASHDLKEPLRVITNYLGLLKRKYGAQLDSKAENFISRTVDAAARMQKLIDDLLSYSRLDNADITYQSVDMNLLFQSVAHELSLLISQSGCTLEVEDLPAVQGDAQQLLQVFINLVSNGIKYHQDGVSPELKITCISGSGKAIFEVKDNGIGIDEQHQQKIFEIFKRLHTRDQYEGTGIGLAIVQKIVTNMQGEVWVKSSPGEGSSFFVSLPLARNYESKQN